MIFLGPHAAPTATLVTIPTPNGQRSTPLRTSRVGWIFPGLKALGLVVFSFASVPPVLWRSRYVLRRRSTCLSCVIRYRGISSALRPSFTTHCTSPYLLIKHLALSPRPPTNISLRQAELDTRARPGPVIGFSGEFLGRRRDKILA